MTVKIKTLSIAAMVEVSFAIVIVVKGKDAAHTVKFIAHEIPWVEVAAEINDQVEAYLNDWHLYLPREERDVLGGQIYAHLFDEVEKAANAQLKQSTASSEVIE